MNSTPRPLKLTRLIAPRTGLRLVTLVIALFSAVPEPAPAQTLGPLQAVLGGQSELQAELPFYMISARSVAIGQTRTFYSYTGLGLQYRHYPQRDWALKIYGRIGIDRQTPLILQTGAGAEHYWLGGSGFDRRDGRHIWRFWPTFSLSSDLRVGYAAVDLSAYALRQGRILVSGKRPDTSAHLFTADLGTTAHYALVPWASVTLGAEVCWPMTASSNDLSVLVMAATLGLRVQF